jgi:hypothetical protein
MDSEGVFVSNFLPSSVSSGVANAGESLKSNLPASAAKSLPDTGGGWVTLGLVGGALFFAGRFLIRRFAR